MTAEEILTEILRFMRDYLGIDAVDDLDLIAAGVDSLRIEELGAFIELRFSVPASRLSLRDAPTPAALAAWVARAR
ncbi:MAG TPA: phosphopantetheine-binding protein [Myxococcota bacterium]|nr:phosphopantetheine-binding protein [Myxococcota bacterium]